MTTKKLRIGIALLASCVSFSVSAQQWPNIPIVGGASYCDSTVNAVCVQTVPAGPSALTGAETLPLDTNLTQGQTPQTAKVYSGFLANASQMAANPKNLFRNGDISVNPFQRGTSQAADITTALLYGPDAFAFLSGTGTAINWSKQTGATDIVANEFTASLRFQRKASQTGVIKSCQYTVLTSSESVALQGSPFVYSFWALAGANFSAAASQIQVTVAYGTGSDQSAANFSTAAWTGQANAVQSLVTISTTWAQYSVAGTIPATATQVGVQICFTPVGTAGTNDWIETSNHQLEAVPNASIIIPSTFEHQTANNALIQAERFLYRITENATISVIANCRSHSVTVQECFVPFPIVMRAAPTMTYTAGFATETTAAGGTLGACSALATATTVTGTASNPFGVLVGCTATTVPAAGVAGFLFSNNGAGLITASSEL